MSEGFIAIALVICLVIYVVVQMNKDEKLREDSEEKRFIASTVTMRSDIGENVVPVYVYYDATVPRRGVKRVVCYYYAMGVCEEKIYVTPFKIIDGMFSLENTISIRKDDLLRIEGSESYAPVMKFYFHFQNGSKFIFSMEESNVKVDEKCEVNIQQKAEQQAAFEIIRKWMTEINQQGEPLHPVMIKVSKFLFGFARLSLVIGVIGLIISIVCLILSQMGMVYEEIEKYSNMAMSLGFYSGFFNWLFGAIFREGSKGF